MNYTRFVRSSRRFLVGATAAAVALTSFGSGTFLFTPLAHAASAVTVSTTGAMNQYFPGAPVPVSSPALAVLRVSVVASAASKTLTSVTANFTGTGFATSDLASLATGDTSGVALYDDVGGGNAGTFGTGDMIVTLGSAPTWSSGNVTLTPATPPALSTDANAPTIFWVAIRTSGTIANNDQIVPKISSAGVVTSDGNGPAADFIGNFVKADTASVSIASVTGYSGSATVTVRFSKPVQKVGGGNLVAADFAYVDGGGTAQTISSVAHTAGQDFATLTMSGNLDAQDISAPATIAAGSNKIADMGGNVLGTTPVSFAGSLEITTTTIPSTTVATKFDAAGTLVTFAARGGTTPYTFAANSAGDTTILTNLNLALASDGKLTSVGGAGGTGVANTPGSHQVVIKVTDSTGTPVTVSKPFTINVAPSGGGGMPGITQVNPPGAAQGASAFSITITGTNTNFSGTSTVAFSLPPGTAGTNGISTGTVTAASVTSLTVPITVAADATVGSRDVKVTSGTQVVVMPNAFGIFASGSSGLTLLFPGNAATNVQMPPGFSFNPSAHASLATYRVTVKGTADFAGAAFWDYVFPKPSDAQNTNGSHCNSMGCGASYGMGTFRTLKQADPLSPNTAYYWQVRTYSEAMASVSDSAVPLESTSVQSFTTVSSITDTAPPSIMHRPVFQATESANLVLLARVMDNLATATTTPALTTKVFYCAGSGCTPSTQANGSVLGSGYYTYTIPNTTIGAAGTIVRYYLQATDGTSTQDFKGASNAPFQLTSVAAGALTITGTVKDSTSTCATAVRQARIFAEGADVNATSSNDANCTFTLSGLAAGTYDLIAIKDGYADRFMSGIPTGSTGIAFKLYQGAAGGFGGDTTKPRIKWTAPMDGMTNMPGADSNFKIVVAFDKAMSQAIMTAANMSVNTVNPATGVLTDITANGAWTYYTTAPSGIPFIPQEGNIAVWALSGTNTLGADKTVAVVVLPSVADTAGNPIQGNQSDGSYVFSFTTSGAASFTNFVSSTGTFEGGGKFGMGEFVPPRVMGTTPPPGSVDVPVNVPYGIAFSDPMADDGGGYILKNFVKLYTVAAEVETDVTATTIDTVVLDTSKTNAKVTLKATYNSGKFAVSTKYRIKMLGGAKSAKNLTLMAPGQEQMPAFLSDFKTASSALGDTAAPSVVGSYPDNTATAVPVNLNAVSLGFSKDMDVSTISTSTVTLTVGSTSVPGTVEYRPTEDAVYFVPKSALNPNTTYTMTVSTGAKGVNGVALASASTRTFTTGSGDTAAPAVSFVNADDYNLAITFSEPIISAKATDSTNFAASVLKPGNYTIKYGEAGASATGTAITLPATAAISYDAVTNTVSISGYHDSSLTAQTLMGKEIYVEVANVKDASGNAITTAGGANTSKATVANSVTTKGALGPMSTASGDFATKGFVPTNFSTESYGFMPPVEVRPFSMMAGKTTIYGARIPISKQVPASGTVVFTFPMGFDVSGAKQDINSPMRTDLNGPGTGAVTFKCLTNVAGGKSCAGTANANDTGAVQGGLADDGVVVNTTSRSVTVYLSAATTASGNDFLTIDIGGIVNSTVPKDFNTGGYTVDVKTMNGTTTLESLTSMPFFIQSAGANTLSGTVTATGNDQAGTMKVYLMSPMTGPMEVDSVNFSDAVSGAADGATAATYSFTSLANGDYMVYTDQAVTIGTGGSAKEFVGKTMPERIIVSGATTYNFTIASATAGTAVTVAIDGPNETRLDIFAGSPSGFKAKQVTLDSSPGAENFTINLTDGTWYLGVGPQMPKGPMAGPPPMPDYVMPKPKELKVTNPTCTMDGTATCTATFTLASASKTIKGVVKDGASRVMANAEVYAYSPNGGYGTHAQSDADGLFTLKVADGSYIVGSFVPGMPNSREVSVTVTSHASTYLLIDGSTTAITPAAAATSFVLKVARPDYTISGKVTDGTNAVQGASVYAYRQNGPGGAHSNTDASGNYTLYVGSGEWKVGAFIPQYGQLTEVTVTVATSNISNQNFSPSQTGTFQTVSGTVTQGGANVQGAFVKIRGNGTFNETMTGADGVYSFKVPEGNGYVLSAFLPGVGEAPPLAAFNVSGSAVENKNFTIGAARTVTVTFSASVTKAFVELMGATTVGNSVQILNATSGTLQVPDGSYTVRVDVPGASVGIADIAATNPATTTYSSTTGIITVADGNEGLTVTLPTLRTVTGTVTDGTTNLAEAWVELVHPTTGVHLGTKTAANGSFSLKVADSATAYMISAMKPGYFREPSTLLISGGNPDAQTLTLSPATRTIAGTVLVGATGRGANAFIRAEKQGGGFAGTQADANGTYTLSVSEGIWNVYAVSEGYAEAALASNPVNTTASSAAGKDITVSTTVSLNAPKSKPITPSAGGTLEDTTSGVKLTIPANALGTSTSAGNLNVKETNNVRATQTATPVANKAKEIKATDSSGNPVTNLNGEVTVEMTYTRAELATTKSASDSSINTLAESEQLKMAYWDETTSNWVTIPSTVAYKNAAGSAITDLTTIDTAAEFAATVSTVTVLAPTTHFSLYAPVSSSGTLPPGPPTNPAATAASSTQINLSWTLVSAATGYDIYRSSTSGGTFSRLGSEPTVSSGSTVTYSDTGLTASTAYYYKLTAVNATGESEPTSEVTATTQAGTAGGGSSGGGGGGSSYSSTPAVTSAVTTPTTTTPTPAAKTETAKKTETAPAPAAKVPTMAEVNAIKIPTIPAKPTVADLQTVLSALQQKLVLLLQMKVAGTLPAPAKAQGTGEGLTKTPAPQAAPQAKVIGRLARGLDVGIEGDDVRALQEFLKSQGAEIYPEGTVSGYFGGLTRAAVGRFQIKYGLVPNAGHSAYGYVGPSTRAKLNELMGE